MSIKIKLTVFICLVLIIEFLIYVWAKWTATLDETNFFAIQPEFIFDKCARNSGRISSFINLALLGMIGHYGLKQIYCQTYKWQVFRIGITVFAINHMTHFFFVFQNFKHHDMVLSIAENLHGFITICGVIIVPVIVWMMPRLTYPLYALILVHLFNVSYFILETFYNKIKPEKPAYHNQFGILVTSIALIYILFRIIREWRLPLLSANNE